MRSVTGLIRAAAGASGWVVTHSRKAGLWSGRPVMADGGGLFGDREPAGRPDGRPDGNFSWTPGRSEVERLVLRGVCRDHVEARVSGELGDQRRLSADPGPVWIDVQGDAPGVIARARRTQVRSRRADARPGHPSAVSHVPTSANGPRNSQYARWGTTTLGRCVIERSSSGHGRQPRTGAWLRRARRRRSHPRRTPHHRRLWRHGRRRRGSPKPSHTQK